MVASESNVEPLLWSAPESAKALAISAKTLWRMTKDGQIPSVRIGRAVRYSPKDIAAWVDSQRSPENVLIK